MDMITVFTQTHYFKITNAECKQFLRTTKNTINSYMSPGIKQNVAITQHICFNFVDTNVCVTVVHCYTSNCIRYRMCVLEGHFFQLLFTLILHFEILYCLDNNNDDDDEICS